MPIMNDIICTFYFSHARKYSLNSFLTFAFTFGHNRAIIMCAISHTSLISHKAVCVFTFPASFSDPLIAAPKPHALWLLGRSLTLCG